MLRRESGCLALRCVRNELTRISLTRKRTAHFSPRWFEVAKDQLNCLRSKPIQPVRVTGPFLPSCCFARPDRLALCHTFRGGQRSDFRLRK